MIEVFADTFFFIALFNTRDPAHDLARTHTNGHPQRLVTTAWVMTELGDAFAETPERAQFPTFLKDFQQEPNTLVIPPSEQPFDRGLDLYERRPDKAWSLTDCISFIVMEDRGIADALTGDRHFEQAGFRAMLTS